MECQHFDDVVMDLLYGELSDDEQLGEAKRHTDRCDRCATVLSNLRTTRKEAVLPVVEAPATVEQHVLAAARRAQREIPWPKRLGRWISWTGSYAMRPQVAMAALLILIIGSSLLLLRGRPGSGRVGAVRVTEQGEPELERAETLVAPVPDFMPPASGAAERARKNGFGDDNWGPRKGDRGGSENEDGPASGGKAEAAASALAQLSASAIASVGPPPSQGALNQFGNMPQQQGGQPPVVNAPPADDYARAMAMYKAKDYANVYRLFDSIAAKGGANAAPAALHAALSVRASAGCSHALPRFDRIIVVYGSTGSGVQARWEAATCARILGDYQKARRIYVDLMGIEGQRKRAEEALSRISPKRPSKGKQQPPDDQQSQQKNAPR